MFVIRDRDAYICQIDDSRFVFHTPEEKETARLMAEARANTIVVDQTEQGLPANATLAERRRLLHH